MPSVIILTADSHCMATLARASHEGPGLRVLGVQVSNTDATTAAERDANVDHACALLLQHPGHEVYLLCEMTTVGYSDEVIEHLDVLAEDADTGPSFTRFAAVARELNAFVVFGFPRSPPAGSAPGTKPTISQTVVGPDGRRVDTYDKLHLCSFGDCAEQGRFRSGDHLTVFEAQRGFRVGVLICYDLRFPEVWRALCDPVELGASGSAVASGVDIVLHPSCFPNDGSFSTWHTFVRARAVENQVYVLSLSRAHPHFGSSIAVGPSPPACLLSPILGSGEEVLAVEVKRDVLAGARAEYTFRADRRTDYTALRQGAATRAAAAV